MIGVASTPAPTEGDVVCPENLPFDSFSQEECPWNLGEAAPITYIKQGGPSTQGVDAVVCCPDPHLPQDQSAQSACCWGCRYLIVLKGHSLVDGMHLRTASWPQICNLHPMTGWWRFKVLAPYTNLGQFGNSPSSTALHRNSSSLLVTVVQSPSVFSHVSPKDAAPDSILQYTLCINICLGTPACEIQLLWLACEHKGHRF